MIQFLVRFRARRAAQDAYYVSRSLLKLLVCGSQIDHLAQVSCYCYAQLTPQVRLFTIFPYVFPTLIIKPVLIMFKTSFVPVPAFILVLPVTTSGPVTILTI